MQLDDRTASLLRAGYESSRRFHWGSAILVAVITAGCVILELGWGEHGLTMYMALSFIPMSIFVLYRATKLPGPGLVETVIANPALVTVIFSVDNGRIKLLAIKLDDERRVTLRYKREGDLETVRRTLAKHAPDAKVSPPL
ncbi:MAG: hypothetical protein WKG01_06885 [Kofleriaceae bacterium]